MNLFVLILTVVGIFMVMHGIYEEKYQELKKNVRVEYRFVPRSYYDEQLFQSNMIDPGIKDKMSSLTEDDQWYNRNVGREMGIDRMKL